MFEYEQPWEDAGNQWESNWNLVRFRELGEQYRKRYRIHWNLTLDLSAGETAIFYSSASQPVGYDPFGGCIAACYPYIYIMIYNRIKNIVMK